MTKIYLLIVAALCLFGTQYICMCVTGQLDKRQPLQLNITWIIGNTDVVCAESPEAYMAIE